MSTARNLLFVALIAAVTQSADAAAEAIDSANTPDGTTDGPAAVAQQFAKLNRK